MSSKIYLYIIIAVILGSVALIVTGPFKSKAASLSADAVVLYWGVGCPHCEKVEDFLSSHKEIEEKIKIERKEVNNDVSNSEELTRAAQSCKLDTKEGVAIPFLYFKGECIDGDQPIIDYLTRKAK